MDAIYTSLLTQTAKISRKILGTIDSFGVPAETLSVISSSTPCLLQPLDADLEISVHGKKEVGKDVLFTEFTANILVDDIVEINSRKFIVLSADDPTGTEHHKEVILKRV